MSRNLVGDPAVLADDAPAGNGPAATSVGKALDLLDLFRKGEIELGVSEMARRLGIAKSSAHRLCRILNDAGYLDRTQHGAYRLGIRLFELGSSMWTRGSVLQQASPFLEQLARASMQTVHLGILDDDEVLYIDKIETHQSRPTPTKVGGRQPLHCSAVGKALLAGQEAPVIERVVSADLHAFTPYTITSPSRLLRELSDVRSTDLGFDHEERALGLVCLATPVRDRLGKVVAAISIAGSTTALTEHRVTGLAMTLKDAGRRLSARLGAKVSLDGATS